MISADEALHIADQAAQRENWGRITSEFHAVVGSQNGSATWEVRRKYPVIGSDFWFRIDAETGAILDKGKRGPR